MRKKLLVGNWKMHKTGPEAAAFVHALSGFSANRRVFLSVPFTAIEQAVKAAQGTGIVIGAQNMHDREEGAFTGEISGRMLKVAGAQFVLLGHSERRSYFAETNAFICRKLHRALEEGLTPILCVGESLEEKEREMTQEVLCKQLQECLKDVELKKDIEMIIAYEPVWAIGTGKAATPETAQQAHHCIRHFIAHKWGAEAAESVYLLYGGSVTQDTIVPLMRQKDIDGSLVGGASLNATVFANLINSS